MNIDDTTLDHQIPLLWPEIVTAIFERQRELMVKYKEIEQLPAAPVSLHTASGQRVIKDFMWRTVEELTESQEAMYRHDDRDVARRHSLEELADSVHFIVEMLIFAGITAEQCCIAGPGIPMIPEVKSLRRPDPTPWFWNVVYALGIAGNFLRNKAWKVSQVPTDEGRFRAAALGSWKSMLDLWGALGCTQEDLYTYYFRKAEVNAFRQRSNY